MWGLWKLNIHRTLCASKKNARQKLLATNINGSDNIFWQVNATLSTNKENSKCPKKETKIRYAIALATATTTPTPNKRKSRRECKSIGFSQCFVWGGACEVWLKHIQLVHNSPNGKHTEITCHKILCESFGRGKMCMWRISQINERVTHFPFSVAITRMLWKIQANIFGIPFLFALHPW